MSLWHEPNAIAVSLPALRNMHCTPLDAVIGNALLGKALQPSCVLIIWGEPSQRVALIDCLPRYADADGPFGMGPYATLPHPIFLLLNHEQWAFRNRGSDSRPRQAMVSLSLGQGARVRCAGPSAGFVGAARSRLPSRRDKAETM